MKTHSYSRLLLLAAGMLAAFGLAAQAGMRVTPQKPVQGEGFGASTSAYQSQVAIAAKFSRTVYLFEYEDGHVVEKTRIPGVNALADQNLTRGFGANLMLKGDWLFVSAPQARIGAGQNNGALQVFHHEGPAWKPVQVLTPPEPATGEKFASAFSFSDGRLVIGAPGTNLATGIVYLYTLDASEWKSQPIKETLDPAAAFGQAVAIDKDWLAVGAPGVTVKREDIGTVFLYQRMPDGTWSRVQQILGGKGVSMLGASLAIENHRLAAASMGKILIYDFNGTLWTQTGEIISPGDVSSFAAKMDFSDDGNRLLVSGSGKAFLYHLERGAWTLKQTYASETSEYGVNPALGDGFIVVNSPLEGQSFVDGAVYFFQLPGLLLPE